MKRYIALFLVLLSVLLPVSGVAASALEQDEIFAQEYKVNDMLVMEGQVFHVYNYDDLAMTYAVTDGSIISNDGEGKFTALKSGECDIILTVGRASKSFKVTVCKPESKVSGAGGIPQAGYFGSASVFGVDSVTLLTPDGTLFLVNTNKKMIIDENVASYSVVGDGDSWDTLEIRGKDGCLYTWTYNSENGGKVEKLYPFIPVQTSEKYILAEDGTLYTKDTLEKIADGVEKFSDCGLVLFSDGTLRRADDTEKIITSDVSGIDSRYPAVLKSSGALFIYTVNDGGTYTAKLIDSSVTGFVGDTDLYTKSNGTTKTYNGEKTVQTAVFAADKVRTVGNETYLVSKDGDVCLVYDGDIHTTVELGGDFSEFYSRNSVNGYKKTDGTVVLSDGTQTVDYSDIANSDFIIEDGTLKTDFGSDVCITAMESVECLVLSPVDGSSAFIFRDDGSVWHCDRWTWYPRKVSEKAMFYPVKCFIEYEIGDVNEDGNLTPNDAKQILRAVAGLTTLSEPQKKAADTDMNGRITTNDAKALLRYIAGLELLKYLEEQQGEDAAG